MNAIRKVAAVFGRPTASGWAAIAAAVIVIGGGVAALTLLNGGSPASPQSASSPNVIHAQHSRAPVVTATPRPTSTARQMATPPPPDKQQQNAPHLGTSDNHVGPTGADKKAWTSPTKVTVPTARKQVFAPGALANRSVLQAQVPASGPVPPGGGTATSATTMFSSTIGPQLADDVTVTRNLTTLVPVTQNACMEQYVNDHIHDYDSKGDFTTATICGHPAVLLGGAAGIDYGNFRGRLASPGAPTAAHNIVYGNHAALNVSAAYTGSGKDNHGTVLIIASDG